MARKSPKSAAPAQPEQRFLLNPRTGRVLLWTEALSFRGDLVECSPDGVPKRAIARKLVHAAEQAEQDRLRRQQAFGGQTAVTDSRDTFGSPNNPVQHTVDNSDLDDES